MEHAHSVDVSWMTHGYSKDKASKNSTPHRNSVSSPAPRETAPAATPPSQPATNGQSNGHVGSPNGSVERTNPVSTRPAPARTTSSEKPNGVNGTPPQRRNSWFANIQNKFTSSPASPTNQTTLAQQPDPAAVKQPSPVVPKITPVRNAVLQHATKHDGETPYTPAPPKTGQAGFLGVFRRLSSSGGALAPGVKGAAHGLVERKVLNVDKHRERCRISNLNQSKLRRVAFSVDVEIAPMPKYSDPEPETKQPGAAAAVDKTQKRKITERGEGDALKNPKAVEEQKERDGAVKSTGEPLPKEPEKEGTEAPDEPKQENGATTPAAVAAADKGGAADKKKEKKKKNEEERKARKEKKRQLAEANGKVPMEIYLDDSDSSADTARTASGTPKTTAFPTTNPVRIYRRCCQLRETPILKKITEQLGNAANFSTETGLVQKLDLTGYWLQLPDVITLGDYLAIVPIKEVVLENCGLTDEGIRVVLAGLLAAKKPEARRRRHCTVPDGLTAQGGVVERLVLKNNKIGPEGWKHICLFVYLCRTVKHLDLSMMAFPRTKTTPAAAQGHGFHIHHSNGTSTPISVATLFSKAIGDRLAGKTLELLNLGDTEPTSEELGAIIDGIIQCGVSRLGLAHNHLDEEGVKHVARYLSRGFCEGIDLGGNDLRERMETIAAALSENDPLWALSLANCNLRPGSLCKIFPKLTLLRDFRFVDFSHNHDLCKSNPSAVGLLRKYLPKLRSLKRIHLADVAMTSEQAIALSEILPEVPGLAHINFLENPDIVALADAKTEETREEACALYASLLAATRVSDSIVCVDIDVPTEESSEIVKALAKQVVAYCLRNLERAPLADVDPSMGVDDAQEQHPVGGGPLPPYPDVLAHLVGHDIFHQDPDTDDEPAPDDDYVIGGTGVVKALACCLKNRGDESRRQSGEFIRDFENGEGAAPATPKPKLPGGKAKDMSKHLLASARKIRIRLQPALAKAQANPSDEKALRRLMFLDQTLAGIINRFEDEFPDTRVSEEPADAEPVTTQSEQLSTSLSSTEMGPEQIAQASDGEEETDLHVRPGLMRTNSVLSHTSKALAVEEGKVLRAGHKFRVGIIRPEQYHLLTSGVDEISEPKHLRMLEEMIEELGNASLSQKLKEKGVLGVFKEDQDEIREQLRAVDPEHWERFIEAQDKARANVQVEVPGPVKASVADGSEESAIADW